MKNVNQYAKILCFVVLFFCLSGLIIAFAEENEEKKVSQVANEKKQDAYEVTGPITVTVILERIYLDGEVSEEIKEETILSMEDFWAEYASWQLVDQDEEQIVFQKNIDDISPLLKANGYFGITDKGILTIFNGKPNSEKVIQSFFQIDIDKLESHQHEELKQGIPIHSKDKYEEVLEVFKPFSLSPTPK
jgi:forespore regulator of the sigma-K checkpoint